MSKSDLAFVSTSTTGSTTGLDEEFEPRPRAMGDAPKTRKCLSCQSGFESEGWHNRLCPSCRKRSSAID